MRHDSLVWTTGLMRRNCVVCGYTGEQNHIATVEILGNPTALIARCQQCDCVLLGDPYPPTENSNYWNDYIETTGGIEAIASYLALVISEKGTRFLDIGCGYGFGLDYAQVARGWIATGVDPSLGGRIGASELGVDIHDGRLDKSLGAQGKFEVIMASEVLEHVFDPHGLLLTARKLLTDDGIFIVTTPNADVVNPNRKSDEVVMALAIGDHQFLTTAHRLKVMLETAGFINVEIDSSTNTLIALAALNPTGITKSQLSSGHQAIKVDEYLEYRGTRAPAGSALAVGMWARLIQSKVFAGEINVAKNFIPNLHNAISSRYQIEISDPVAISRLTNPPVVLTQICYLLGFIYFIDEQFSLATEYFEASLRTIARYDVTQSGQPVPRTALFQVQALGHLALAQANINRRASKRALKKLDQLVADGICDKKLAVDFRTRALSITRQKRYLHTALRKITPSPIRVYLRNLRSKK